VGGGAIFFQCPESTISGASTYWLTLERWCRGLDPQALLNLPAVDCDAIAAIRDARKES
jgi:hypothetical protein